MTCWGSTCTGGCDTCGDTSIEVGGTLGAVVALLEGAVGSAVVVVVVVEDVVVEDEVVVGCVVVVVVVALVVVDVEGSGSGQWQAVTDRRSAPDHEPSLPHTTSMEVAVRTCTRKW